VCELGFGWLGREMIGRDWGVRHLVKHEFVCVRLPVVEAEMVVT